MRRRYATGAYFETDHPCVLTTSNRYTAQEANASFSDIFHEVLSFTTDISNMAICAKPTHKLCIFYGVITESMQTVKCLLGTGTGFNSFKITPILSQYRINIERGNTPYLRISTWKSLCIERPILFQFRLCNLIIPLYFGAADILAVHMLSETPFIDRFIRRIFSAEHKVVVWQYYSLEIHLTTTHDKQITSHTFSNLGPTGNTSTHFNHMEPYPISVVQQSLQELYKENRFLVTTTPLSINTFCPKLFEGAHQKMFAPHDKTDFLPSHPFYTVVNIFPQKQWTYIKTL